MGFILPDVLLSRMVLCYVRCGRLTVRVVLDILAVDPAYQGRGAGSMLVQWGLDLANELGLDVSLVSCLYVDDFVKLM